MPTNGIRKIARSHAIAAVGLRSRGMMMSAAIRMARSASTSTQPMMVAVSALTPTHPFGCMGPPDIAPSQTVAPASLSCARRSVV